MRRASASTPRRCASGAGAWRSSSRLAEGADRRRALDGVPLSCWEARRHVSDYLDGHVDGSLARALETHLAGCPTCPPLYTSLVGVRASLGGLRDRDDVVPEGVASRIEQRLADAAR